MDSKYFKRKYWIVIGLCLVLAMVGNYSFDQYTYWGFVGKLVVAAGIGALLLIGLRVLRLGKPVFFKSLAILIIATVSIWALETLLRSPAMKLLNLQTYMERKGSPNYLSPYGTAEIRCDSCNGTYQYILPPYSIHEAHQQEFSYDYQCNSLGLFEKELPKAKPKGEYRIMGIGDSFMAGIGAPSDSSLLKQLEAQLNTIHDTIHYLTINAGVPGSDVVFEYRLLTNCLLGYKPDLLILNLNSSDIVDIITRGGDERFDAEGNFVKKKGPWWEYLFGSSYIVRLICFKVLGINWEFVSQCQMPIVQTQTLGIISKKIDDFQRLADKEHFQFLLVVQPMPMEALAESDNVLKRLKISAGIHTLDLEKYMQSHISKDSMKHCFWPADGHFNAKGYGIEANAIYNEIKGKQR